MRRVATRRYVFAHREASRFHRISTTTLWLEATGNSRCVPPQRPLLRLTAAAGVAGLTGLHAGLYVMSAYGGQLQTPARPVPSRLMIEILGEPPALAPTAIAVPSGDQVARPKAPPSM